MEVVEGTSPAVGALAAGNSEVDTTADRMEAVHIPVVVEGSPDSSYQALAAKVSAQVVMVCKVGVVLLHPSLIIVSRLLCR